MKKRWLILAAGHGIRWGDKFGIPKHLVDVGGEQLLSRTIRQLKELGERDIYLVSRDYVFPGVNIYVPRLDPENKEADKFLSSIDLWRNTKKDFVFLYGDVYFTDSAIKKIAETRVKDWALFARFGESEITGKQHGECFAFRFTPMMKLKLERTLLHLVDMRKDSQISRNGGWELYSMLEGFLPMERKRGSHLIEIDDFTEDFDFPEDYERWARRIGIWKEEEKKERKTSQQGKGAGRRKKSQAQSSQTSGRGREGSQKQE
jgi:hypothetical protein